MIRRNDSSVLSVLGDIAVNSTRRRLTSWQQSAACHLGAGVLALTARCRDLVKLRLINTPRRQLPTCLAYTRISRSAAPLKWRDFTFFVHEQSTTRPGWHGGPKIYDPFRPRPAERAGPGRVLGSVPSVTWTDGVDDDQGSSPMSVFCIPV